MKIATEKNSKILIWIGISLLIIGLFFFLYKSSFNIKNEVDTSKLSEFGDYFGGVIGAIWSLAGVILLYVALDEQRKDIKINQNALIKQIEEFELQRVELSETREIFKEQSITLKIQRFENTFFQLINLYNEIISNLQITYNNESYEKRDVFAFGLNNLSNIFSVYLKEYKQNKFGDWNFNNVEELKSQLRIHIPKRTNSLLKNPNKSNSNNFKINDETTKFIEESEFGVLDFVIQFEDYLANVNLSLNGITQATNVIAEEFNKKTSELERLQKLPNFNKNQIAGILSRTAKSVDNYTNRLLIETPAYQENFESAIKAGTLYLNSITKENIEENRESLDDLLESVRNLKSNIPNAINGMFSFYNAIKDLPNLYSVFTKAKNKLVSQLETLNSTLKHSYDLTHEYEGEIEYKLKM